MSHRFLYWCDHRNQKSGKIKGSSCQLPLPPPLFRPLTEITVTTRPLSLASKLAEEHNKGDHILTRTKTKTMILRQKNIYFELYINILTPFYSKYS